MVAVGTKPAIVMRHPRPAGETPFDWRFAGGSIMSHSNGVSLVYPYWPILRAVRK